MESSRHTITVVFPASCLTCRRQVRAGELAFWEREIGLWHIDCPEPRSLSFHIARRDAKDRERAERA